MRHRSDKNQDDIVEALRAAGISVEVLSQVGNGCPDLLVGFRGRNFLFEVKGKRGALNEKQKKWHFEWRGQKAVVRSFEEVRRILNV